MSGTRAPNGSGYPAGKKREGEKARLIKGSLGVFYAPRARARALRTTAATTPLETRPPRVHALPLDAPRKRASRTVRAARRTVTD